MQATLTPEQGERGGQPAGEGRWRGAGIQLKLSSIIVALVIALAALLAALFTSHHLADLEQSLTRKAETYGLLASRELASAVAFDDRQTAREVFEAMTADDAVRGLALYGASGALLEARGELETQAKTLRPPARLTVTRTATAVVVVAPVVSVEGPRGALVLELTMAAAAAARDRTLILAVSWGALAALVGLVAAWFIARSFAGRIGALSRAAGRVAAGDLDQPPLTDRGRDEIARLTVDFNIMCARLRGLLAQIQHAAREEAGRLEALVTERTAALNGRNAEMRLVLDNVDQGLVTLDRGGRVSVERSRVLDRWFSAPLPGLTLWDWISAADEPLRSWWAAGWQAVLDDVLPLEVAIDQLPRRLERDGCVFEIGYKPLLAGDRLDRVLVVITDVTAREQHECAEEAQNELLRVIQRVWTDRELVLEFFEDARRLVDTVVDASADDGVELARALHTLKGNAAMLGLGGLARLCDQLEGGMAEAGGELDRTGRQQLAGRWQDEERRFAAVLDAGQSRRLEVDGDEYEALLGAARGGLQAAELLRWLESWRQEPVERRLGQLGEQAERLAARLGKSPLRVTIDAGDLRLPPRALSEFWSACVHVVRNAVDHGIESADERRAAGKPAVAEIALAARLEEGGEGARFELEVRDSGRGIDWGLVKQGAARAGHAASTEAQLREALFADGVTTRDAATELSGRGVGLGAARSACERTGGVMAIYSERGVGTRVCFRWPAAALGVARGHGEPARGPVAPAPEAAVSGQSSATTAA